MIRDAELGESAVVSTIYRALTGNLQTLHDVLINATLIYGCVLGTEPAGAYER